MSLKDKLSADFKAAFKSGDINKKDALSLLRAAIQNKEIELHKKEEGLSDDEVIAVLSSEAKKRKDAITEYEKAGREEQAAQERSELLVIETYLPAQMGRDEVIAELKKIISETGASGKQDLGKVMGQAMARMKGQVDGTVVKEEAEKLL